MKDYLTAEDAAGEDWTLMAAFSELRVECLAGHAFVSHAKFSGRLVAIVSRSPCPECGNHSLRGVYGQRESQTLTSKDVGDAEENT